MKKILIANRGEIALRVMKTAKQMGIRTVAVFSDADRHAPYVSFADEAVHIGPSPSNQSYLDGKKIINSANELGVEGIHPGYGFLSENAAFAEEVEAAGITFIGPRPEAIRIMGSKLAAKEAVKNYNIPMVPGIDEAISDVHQAAKIAEEIGYPIMVKASAGGGGKGMRIISKSEDLASEMQRAISEAESAFGDGSVFIEKYVASPRHIEIQILADQYGNVIHLFERECSIQRRHQKVVEEAPSAVLTPEVRKEMGEAAIRVAKSCNYVGAGTVEFLLDHNSNFYFLEMNTRLQVEHPVTELITGLDLVEQQIRIARGEKLTFKQEDLNITGHAIELRVYAEDPLNDFLPAIGTISKYRKPTGEGVRVDDGYVEGMEIPIYYDSMISKLITYGSDRENAIKRMKDAIANYQIEGVITTLSFGSFVMDHEAFLTGDFNTHFVRKYFDQEKVKEGLIAEEAEAALIAVSLWKQELRKIVEPVSNASAWRTTRI